MPESSVFERIFLVTPLIVVFLISFIPYGVTLWFEADTILHPESVPASS